MNSIKRTLAKAIYQSFRRYIVFNIYKSPVTLAYMCEIYIFGTKIATLSYTGMELLEKRWLIKEKPNE